jgi:hypothetical protein
VHRAADRRAARAELPDEEHRARAVVPSFTHEPLIALTGLDWLNNNARCSSCEQPVLAALPSG